MIDLIIFDAHPVQYRAPIYRCLARRFGIDLLVVYQDRAGDLSYFDAGFNVQIRWDVDLLEGYRSIFVRQESEQSKLSRISVGKLLKKYRPKAGLIVGYERLFYLTCFYQLWRNKVPILFRAETTDHTHKRNVLKNGIRDFLLKIFYSRVSRFLYIGRHSQSHYDRLGISRERQVLSPYCIDDSVFDKRTQSANLSRSEMRRQWKADDERFVFLFSGKLISKKAPQLILEAANKLLDSEKRKISLLFVGDGNLRSSLEKKARDIPALQIHFPGFQNQTQLSAYYNAADCLILPSRHSETWGLVVNEALHHGIPAIVSQAVGSAPDLIIPGVTGEIFKTGCASSLADAMKNVLRYVKMPGTREACQAKANSYSMDMAAEGIVRAYRDVAGTAKGRE